MMEEPNYFRHQLNLLFELKWVYIKESELLRYTCPSGAFIAYNLLPVKIEGENS